MDVALFLFPAHRKWPLSLDIGIGADDRNEDHDGALQRSEGVGNRIPNRDGSTAQAEVSLRTCAVTEGPVQSTAISDCDVFNAGVLYG